MVNLLMYLLVFFLGAAVGSFLNVLISRSIQGKNWVNSRSVCDHCKKPLRWYDMIPLLSYLFLGGRSACCRKKLSLQHPVVEVLTGALFLWWAMMGTYFFNLVTQPLFYIQPSYWLLIGILLTVIAVSDLFYGLIPAYAVYLGVGITLLYRILLVAYGEYQSYDLLISILSAAITAGFFQFLRIITKRRGMGDGDVILAVLMGLILSYPRVLVGVWMAFILGSLWGIGMILMKKKKLGMTLPFGPFMVVGTLVALLYGNIIWRLWMP